MKVLITGGLGFVGQNLDVRLKEEGIETILFDKDHTVDDLIKMIHQTDFIVHLAGVNRPLNKEEFYQGNSNLTYQLTELVKQENRNIPIIFSSSIQAVLDNDYGKSKKQAEDYLIKYQKETNNDVYIFRLPNLFGKWSRPNYNSVVATFCHNISHDLPITINDPNYLLPLVYIDDVVNAFIEVIKQGSKEVFNIVSTSYSITLGELAKLINSFRESRKSLFLPEVGNPLTEKLYATYLTYLDETDFGYKVKSHVDERGSFTELFKTLNNGQFSVNVAKPGITKGNHYHHKKNEKFIVLSGEGVINFRHIFKDTTITVPVNGKEITVVDIIPGYTHSITNTGTEDLVFFIWASEIFNPNRPDTVFEKVSTK